MLQPGFTVAYHATCTLPETITALRTFHYMLRKWKFTRLSMVVMATVKGYSADKDSVYVYFIFWLTNLTQLPYRNFSSALQLCNSN